ncbi:hypothetical protein [Paracoccus ravus]|uniref:hypothetical protein n=1 Tax=Paracoccus ravus TaxID=2447760 RepID=UPI00106DE26E|nr:hypothetical protein [Paracoccus ravus]
MTEAEVRFENEKLRAETSKMLDESARFRAEVAKMLDEAAKQRAEVVQIKWKDLFAPFVAAAAVIGGTAAFLKIVLGWGPH